MKMVRLAGLSAFLMLGVSPQSAWAEHCLTIVTIDNSGKVVRDPVTLACHPDDRVMWVVVNDYSKNIKVTFDKFEIRGTNTSADPLGVASHPMTIQAGRVEVSNNVKVKKKADFGTPALPWGGFKYAITVHEVGGGNPQIDHLDPDLDVTPPPTIGPEGRGGRRGRGGR